MTAQLIDDTLYDAFGQRQVAITYTPLNQYHVVMEVAPPFWQRPETLRDIYVHSPNGAEVPLSAFTHYKTNVHLTFGQPSGAVSGGHHLLQPGTGMALWGTR